MNVSRYIHKGYLQPVIDYYYWREFENTYPQSCEMITLYLECGHIEVKKALAVRPTCQRVHCRECEKLSYDDSTTLA